MTSKNLLRQISGMMIWWKPHPALFQRVENVRWMKCSCLSQTVWRTIHKSTHIMSDQKLTCLLFTYLLIYAWCFLSERDYVTFGYLRQQIRLRLSVVSVVCNVRAPTQPVEIFGNVSRPFCTLAIRWLPCKILLRSSHGNPSTGALNASWVAKSGDSGPMLQAVKFLCSTQPVKSFGNVYTPFHTLAILRPPCKILQRSSQKNPFTRDVKCKRGRAKIRNPHIQCTVYIMRSQVQVQMSTVSLTWVWSSGCVVSVSCGSGSVAVCWKRK